MKYDIFISYKRRGTSSATAAYLYELLLNKGYNVFFDRKELRSGMFDEQLLAHISDAQRGHHIIRGLLFGCMLQH